VVFTEGPRLKAVSEVEVNVEEVLIVILPGNEQMLMATKKYMSAEYPAHTVAFRWYLPS